MKRIIPLLISIVMVFGLVACGSKPTETTIPAETTAPAETTIPAETTVPAEPTAPTAPAETTVPTTDGELLELPVPELFPPAPRKMDSIEGKNGTVFKISKYWKFYDNTFPLNQEEQFAEIHFVTFDYEAWSHDHPNDRAGSIEYCFTLSVSGATMLQVDLYHPNIQQDDENLSAYVDASWYGAQPHLEESNPSEITLYTNIELVPISLFVFTLRDNTTGEIYLEYFGVHPF